MLVVNKNTHLLGEAYLGPKVVLRNYIQVLQPASVNTALPVADPLTSTSRSPFVGMPFLPSVLAIQVDDGGCRAAEVDKPTLCSWRMERPCVFFHSR